MPCSYNAAMTDYNTPEIIEAYQIERTVDILLGVGRNYRLEVVRAEKEANAGQYHVRVYERKSLYRFPSGDIRADGTSDAAEFYVWLPDISIPTYERDTPEDALKKALELVVERRNNKNSIPW